MNAPRILAAAALLVICATAFADEAAPLSALARMPVKEVTVFKDGHAFVLHEGAMPVNARGNVELDYLPNPVLGTYWPYSADPKAKLAAVTSGVRRVLVTRTALTVRELLEANPGAEVRLAGGGMAGGGGLGSAVFAIPPADATILRIPTRSADEIQSSLPPGSPEVLPQKSDIILLKTSDGVTVVPLNTIATATFRGEMKSKVTDEEFRSLLTLKLDWAGGQPARTASVGMMYLQKGLRWIPEYRVTLDGKGGALVKLQASLVNELADLNDVTANLVIGVPSFAFKDTQDPIGFQQAVAQLSPYFQTDSRTGYGFSNAIMSQARAGEAGGGGFGGANGPAGPGGAPAPRDLGPEVAGTQQAEDLFVFTVKHVTLKRGERMVLPVAEYRLKYRDVYTLNIPLRAPADIRPNVSGEQQAELARMLNAPKVEHRIRLTDSAAQPLTTAPALIVMGDRVLGQGMMTYTSPGSESDLTITTATNIKVARSDKETGRTPNAETWQGQRYGRVDMSGAITLTNFGAKPADLEVTRYVAGLAEKADHDGKVEMLGSADDPGSTLAGDTGPYGAAYYNWPFYWWHFNGIGRFTWKPTLPAGQSVTLNYSWHYFWQW